MAFWMKKIIYRIINETFARSEKYSSSIALLTDDSKKLNVIGISTDPKKLESVEKEIKIKSRDYQFPLKKSNAYWQVVKEGKTVIKKTIDILREILPRLLIPIIRSNDPTIEDRYTLLTPIYEDEKIIGVFSLGFAGLTVAHIPTIKNLAAHISLALKLSQETAERDLVEKALTEQTKFNELRANIWKIAADKSISADDLIQKLLDKIGPSLMLVE